MANTKKTTKGKAAKATEKPKNDTTLEAVNANTYNTNEIYPDADNMAYEEVGAKKLNKVKKELVVENGDPSVLTPKEGTESDKNNIPKEPKSHNHNFAYYWNGMVTDY